MYSLPGCRHCQRARTLLASRSISYDEIEGGPTPEFRAKLAELNGTGLAPAIVINGHGVGGASELARLDRLGVLMPLVQRERFPRAFPQKRLSLSGLLRSGFGLFSAPGREPSRHIVAIVDEKGQFVETREAGSEDEATALADELNATSP
ncbi:MAG: glutaredoxin family protein [Gaiellaceae bacterium]